PETRLEENRDGGRVGDEIGAVLVGPGAGQTPVAKAVQGGGDCRHRLVQDLEQLIVVHRWATLTAATAFRPTPQLGWLAWRSSTSLGTWPSSRTTPWTTASTSMTN